MKRYILSLLLIVGTMTEACAQVVDNQLGQRLQSIFPEISNGYIDLNGNGEKDRTIELDENVPDSKVKDNIIQVQEILDFLVANYRFIPLQKLVEVQESLKNASGTIPEIIGLTYRDRIEEVIARKRELGETGIYLTPSAREDALATTRSLIATMVHAYKKEGKSFESQFIEARDELFSMIEKGYPFPENLNNEDATVLENSMINTLVNNSGSNPGQARSAIKTLGKLESQTAVPYLIDLLQEEEFKLPTIQALGEIGTQQALDLLTQELEKAASVQEKTVIIGALGKIGGEAGMDRIVSLFPQKEEEAIAEGIEEPALQALLSLAQNGNTNNEIFNIFKRYTRNEDPELRTTAVKGLAYYPGANSGELLIALLKEEKNDKVLSSIIRSLNSVGHSATIATFINMLRDQDVSAEIKAEIVGALGENPEGPKAIQYIIEHLGSGNNRLRNAVSETLVNLYEIDPKTVSGYVARGLRTSDDETYLTEGTAILATIADESSLPTLLVLLQKPYPEMKKNITWAFYRIRTAPNARIVGELAKLVTSETEPLAVRINSIRALGAMGYDSPQLNVWQTLVTTAKMRGEKYSLLKLFAIQSLGSLDQRNEEVISTLTGIAVRDQDLELKKEAIRSLRKLGIVDRSTAGSLANLFKRNEDTELKILIVEMLGDMGAEETNEPASSILFQPNLDIPKKRRIIYALSKAGTEKDFSLILDAAADSSLQEFIQGVVVDADAAVMQPLIERRLQTESNQEILGMLETLQSVYESRF